MYAITAAHCLTQAQVPSPADTTLKVRMYMPGPNLTPDPEKNHLGWKKAAALSPSDGWPNFTHTKLTAEDGYVFEDYECQLVMRCGGTFNGDKQWEPYNCDAGPSKAADVALLRCDRRDGKVLPPKQLPGMKHHLLNVAQAEAPMGGSVYMPWKHEVYDIPNQPESPLYQRYTVRVEGQQEENFHYFGGEDSGNERNQLLPLESTGWWCGGVWLPRRKLQYSQVYDAVYTELMGCHGTSGSSIMEFNTSTQQFEILGPNARGDGELWDRLCSEPSYCNPGEKHMAYSSLANSQYVAQFADDCKDAGLPGGNLLLWLACSTWMFVPPLLLSPCPIQWPCLFCSPWEQLRVHNEPVIEVSVPKPVSIPGASFVAAAAYRISVRTVAIVGEDPPLVTLRVGNQVIVAGLAPRHDPEEHELLGLVAARFYAERNGVQPVQIAADALSGKFSATEIVVAREDEVNDFGTIFQRAGFGLVPAGGLTAAGEVAVPMRFVARGLTAAEGYGPLLLANERMVVSRAAFVEGRRWKVGFDASASSQDLTCGLILSDGTAVTEPCNVESLVELEMEPPAAAQPVAFYIEAGPDAQPVLFHELGMQSLPPAGEVDVVSICHFPPGKPSNAHTITVEAPALKAHLAHGDTIGQCPEKAGVKMIICHYPPGDPGNPQTIEIAPAALPAHLAHGDTLGSCPLDD
ncbi:MAG: hypothetical protein HY744_00285 [Deltaproteobacteria bacterium]|nr:hypothetical protein [Deltaproteobacteria bacterium]